jgi:hypothetical protein
LVTGDTVIVFITAERFNTCFAAIDQQLVGIPVTIIDPLPHPEWGNNMVFTTRDLVVPIDLSKSVPWYLGYVQPISIPDVFTEKNLDMFRSFSLTVDRLYVSGAYLVVACGCVACDGTHGKNKSCISSVAAGVLPKHALSARIKLFTAGKNDVFATVESVSFARFFLEEEIINNIRYDISSIVLREHIGNVTEQAFIDNVKFNLYGWYRLTRNSLGTVTSSKFHISRITLVENCKLTRAPLSASDCCMLKPDPLYFNAVSSIPTRSGPYSLIPPYSIENRSMSCQTEDSMFEQARAINDGSGDEVSGNGSNVVGADGGLMLPVTPDVSESLHSSSPNTSMFTRSGNRRRRRSISEVLNDIDTDVDTDRAISIIAANNESSDDENGMRNSRPNELRNADESNGSRCGKRVRISSVGSELEVDANYQRELSDGFMMNSHIPVTCRLGTSGISIDERERIAVRYVPETQPGVTSLVYERRTVDGVNDVPETQSSVTDQPERCDSPDIFDDTVPYMSPSRPIPTQYTIWRHGNRNGDDGSDVTESEGKSNGNGMEVNSNVVEDVTGPTRIVGGLIGNDTEDFYVIEPVAGPSTAQTQSFVFVNRKTGTKHMIVQHRNRSRIDSYDLPADHHDNANVRTDSNGSNEVAIDFATRERVDIRNNDDDGQMVEDDNSELSNDVDEVIRRTGRGSMVLGDGIGTSQNPIDLEREINDSLERDAARILVQSNINSRGDLVRGGYVSSTGRGRGRSSRGRGAGITRGRGRGAVRGRGGRGRGSSGSRGRRRRGGLPLVAPRGQSTMNGTE